MKNKMIIMFLALISAIDMQAMVGTNQTSTINFTSQQAAHAIKQGNFNLVQQYLNAGLDPNFIITEPGGDTRSALDLALVGAMVYFMNNVSAGRGRVDPKYVATYQFLKNAGAKRHQQAQPLDEFEKLLLKAIQVEKG